MQTRTKIQTLAIVGGVFGWIWLVASAAAVYFFIAALAFDGSWSRFFWAFGIGVIGKWLLRGFEDSKRRVAYEAALVARGMSEQEAGSAWMQAYSGGPDLLAEMLRKEQSSANAASDSAA